MQASITLFKALGNSMNAVMIAVLVMVALSLLRVSVVFALVAGALVGGLVGGLSLEETLGAFNDGVGGGAQVAIGSATQARAVPRRLRGDR